MDVSSYAASQKSLFDVNTQILDHMELLSRANEEKQLSELELDKLRIIVRNRDNQGFFTFLRQRTLARNQQIPMRNMAWFLIDHPAARVIWLQLKDHRYDPDDLLMKEWVDGVYEKLKSLEGGT